MNLYCVISVGVQRLVYLCALVKLEHYLDQHFTFIYHLHRRKLQLQFLLFLWQFHLFRRWYWKIHVFSSKFNWKKNIKHQTSNLHITTKNSSHRYNHMIQFIRWCSNQNIFYANTNRANTLFLQFIESTFQIQLSHQPAFGKISSRSGNSCIIQPFSICNK